MIKVKINKKNNNNHIIGDICGIKKYSKIE